MDSETHLKPAYSEGKLNREQLSAEEFHRKLYEFFEDRGLLSDLKSHLRTKMINALKETPIGRNECKQSMSPKMQAINLLLAEFMIQQNCFYSLSVFSTEVPLANILPELNNNLVKMPGNGWRFQNKDAFDILETLGFEKDTEILNSYFNLENNDSLLVCILKVLAQYIKSATIINKDEISFKSIEEILIACKLPLLTVELIVQKFIQIKDDIIKEYKEKYEKTTKQTEIALAQAKSSDKIVETMKQEWQNKYKMLELKEKQLKEKELELQKKEEELNEMKRKYIENNKECDILKRKIEELKEENIRLENFNGEQRRKAEKLKINARLLSSELSATRTQRRRHVNNNNHTKGVPVSGEGEQGKNKCKRKNNNN